MNKPLEYLSREELIQRIEELEEQTRLDKVFSDISESNGTRLWPLAPLPDSRKMAAR